MILISAGEASGDAVGAAIVEQLTSLNPEWKLVAVGGKRLKSAGAHLLEDSTHWGAIGIFQSLLLVPKIYAAFVRVKRWIRRNRPELLIAIDFGAFNVRLCKYAKSHGCKVLYFMPPGSWKRNQSASNLPTLADKIATPFEWSAKDLGGEWVGHPLVQMLSNLPHFERDRIAIMPGSRKHEIVQLLPVMAQAIEKCETNSLLIEIVCAPIADQADIQKLWKTYCSKPALISTNAAETLCRSKAALVCSGTATLEAAICQTPMVICYRVPKWSEFEARLIRFKFDLIGLPNIILGRAAFPELVQNAATADAICEKLQPLLHESAERTEQLKSMKELMQLLGPANAIDRTADIVTEMLMPSKEKAPHRS